MTKEPISPGPLSKIRVLEVTHMLAGPYCGMLLADLGADVIKIEPSSGDIARRIGPHYVGPHNVYFASLNRNKRSVYLDLATPEGQAALGELAKGAHALITNMRPAVIHKLGLTYEHLKRWNDRLVCVALTGYGLTGPYADRPAYDYVIQALAGIMTLTGDPDGAPTKAGFSIVDNSSGIMGAVGLLAKIVEGKGGQVDVSLYDVMLSQLNYLAAAYLNADERPRRYRNGAHPYIVPAQIFPTHDGYLALFISHDRFWQSFAEEVKRPDWLTDPCFATMGARNANRERVIAEVEALIKTDDTARWVERLGKLGIVVAGIETLEQALESDLTAARGMIETIETAHGTLRLVGNPFKLAGYEATHRPAPLLGEHNAELLGGTGAGSATEVAPPIPPPTTSHSN
ncbi:MAG: CaiB/BaiF CoA transferase family protein [Acidiferrobacterales bacterium]